MQLLFLSGLAAGITHSRNTQLTTIIDIYSRIANINNSKYQCYYQFKLILAKLHYKACYCRFCYFYHLGLPIEISSTIK